MRALILLESLVVVALAVGILLHKPPSKAAAGEVFPANRLLMDAMPNERAVYRADDGTSIEYVVNAVNREGRQGPVLSMTRVLRDAAGNLADHGTVPYHHVLASHGFFPLMAPEVPGDLDRVWVLRRIRRDDLPFRNTQVRCWKVDFVDPALPPDAEAVEVWFQEDAPVFGILKWQRNGRVYLLESGR